MSAGYIIKYEYNSWLEGCGCCSDSSSEMTVYAGDGWYITDFDVTWMENEQELREFIAEYHPQYINFTVHEDTRWF